MAKKTTVKELKVGAKALKPVLMPEATAHIVQRELTFTPTELAKLQAALDKNLPLKMSVGLHSKIWGTGAGSSTTMKLMKVGTGPTADDEIVDQPVEPPDDGTVIPTDAEEPPPEIYAATASFAKASLAATKGRKLVGAKVKFYAVAVFQPEFSKGSGEI